MVDNKSAYYILKKTSSVTFYLCIIPSCEIVSDVCSVSLIYFKPIVGVPFLLIRKVLFMPPLGKLGMFGRDLSSSAIPVSLRMTSNVSSSSVSPKGPFRVKFLLRPMPVSITAVFFSLDLVRFVRLRVASITSEGLLTAY